MNYEQAKRKLLTARNQGAGKPFGSSTRLVYCSVVTERYDWNTGGSVEEIIKAIGVKYHDTIVVAIMEDGRYRIDTGGWWTKTTKERIQDTIGLRLRAIGRTFTTVYGDSNEHWLLPTGDRLENGMVINADWSATGLIASVVDRSPSATRGEHWVPTPNPYTTPREEFISHDAFSMRFDDMNEEAEREMSEWRKILGRNQ